MQTTTVKEIVIEIDELYAILDKESEVSINEKSVRTITLRRRSDGTDRPVRIILEVSVT